ncbi:MULTISPECIES: hypothetical protein [16SrI (Aster yellows group)]|uniref:Uncharacterized protein n=2 Tax=16SrI (Aster yellows group) TaxID=3042590 RepID=A0A859I8N7_9MOLU|nr:hypothetical protein [Chrysanthemum yellows phytoplasma]QKX95116.1 MAG: hypothetical protein RP166_1030 [Rapeseed phyllody phytoplasma]
MDLVLGDPSFLTKSIWQISVQKEVKDSDVKNYIYAFQIFTFILGILFMGRDFFIKAIFVTVLFILGVKLFDNVCTKDQLKWIVTFINKQPYALKVFLKYFFSSLYFEFMSKYRNYFNYEK